MKPIIVRFTPQQVNRVLAEHVISATKPTFVGHVSASVTRVPENCPPAYWQFELTLTLTPKRKARK